LLIWIQGDSIERARGIFETSRNLEKLTISFCYPQTGDTMAESTDPASSIVIIGGGIIGACTAYYLSTHPSSSGKTITILEASSVAAAASGRAGGLLAKWAYPACLSGVSFDLHEELAKKFNGAERWGYRRVTAGQIDAIVGGKMKKKSIKNKWPQDLNWLNGDVVDSYEIVADANATAQVHPKLFTQAMAEEAQKNGVKLILGRATKINESSGSVVSVLYTPNNSTETETLAASIVILAAGPWSSTIIPSLPLETVRAHSLVIKTPEVVSPYAFFTSITIDGTETTPEIYARPDSTIYTCGEPDRLVSLPLTANEVQVDRSFCDELLEQVSKVSKVLADGEIITRQACYLPNVRGEGGPLVGKTKTNGLIVATGHTCWGINNSAATGKLVSEIVFEGKAKSSNITPLDPAKWGL
jgi:glycine/D-amino acid oxidase-like deaminating enzyme